VSSSLPSVRLPQVLLVSPAVTPPWLNGTVLMARDLATGGSRFEYRVMGTDGQSRELGAARVEPIYPRRHSRLAFTGRIRVLLRLLRRDHCVLHHFFFSPHRTVARVTKAVLAVSRKPSIHTVPSQPSGDDLKQLMFADRVVACSEATAILLRSAGVSDVRVIRPSVDVPELVDKSEYRARLKSQRVDVPWEDRPVFVYAGDLEFSNGADVFVKAARAAADRMPDARFVLACRAKTPASHVALESLKRLVMMHGLQDRVHFAGVVPDIKALLGGATAVVMPVDTLYAKVDTPYVLLEAMALGVPVIVSNIPALGELAGLGTGATVVPVNEADATAEAMVALAEDPARATRQGRAARRTVADYFNHKHMVEAYEALYQEVLHGQS